MLRWHVKFIVRLLSTKFEKAFCSKPKMMPFCFNGWVKLMKTLIVLKTNENPYSFIYVEKREREINVKMVVAKALI